MANEEQLSILKQGVDVWNEWHDENPFINVDLSEADLREADLGGANLTRAQLSGADLTDADFKYADLTEADLSKADLRNAWFFRANMDYVNLSSANLESAFLESANLMIAHLVEANLSGAILRGANLIGANLTRAKLIEADLSTYIDNRLMHGGAPYAAFARRADLTLTNLTDANFEQANLEGAVLTHASLTKTSFRYSKIGDTILVDTNLSTAIGIETIRHSLPSTLSLSTIRRSERKLPVEFLRGCGLSDWEIQSAKLYDPDLSANEIDTILYRMHDLRVGQALQISPLFISYSHADGPFVDNMGDCLTEKGIRYWRDIHDMKAGRMEKQVDRAIRQNPTVLLVLSRNSLNSDWVEHEVRTARDLEKEMRRDVLCPVALDDSWKDSRWPKRIMEQIMEYNILDFSEWEDDDKFDDMFRKLIDGLELFYKG